MILGLASAAQVVGGAWRAAWAVRAECLPSEWAEKHRVLTKGASAEDGAWKNSRTPYLVEIMDRMRRDDPCEFIVIRKPTQWGGSEVLFNALGWAMAEREPTSIGLVVPGLTMAKRHVRQRIDPAIAASPVWAKAVAKPRGRDSTNSVYEKSFQQGAGIFFVITANSSEGLRAIPICLGFGDEVSKWKTDLDGEGSALAQFIGRTTSYQGLRKVMLVSSATIADQCQISELLETLTDWREYHVPCPLCGVRGVLDFENLTAAGLMHCPHCGGQYGEEHKTAILAEGQWIPRHPERGPLWIGYDSNALYTPIRMGDGWASLARQRAEAMADVTKSKMVAFTQQKMGKPYRGERDQQDADQIAARAEPGVRLGTVPDGYLMLSGGVDMQGDRAEGHVIAWGRGERAHVVDYWVVDCDPTDPDGYDAVDAAMRRSYAKRGRQMVVANWAVDGGNWSEKVAGFVRRVEDRHVQAGGVYQRQRVVLCRGRSTETGRVVNRPKREETTSRGRTLATSVGMWGVGTGAAKTILLGRIANDVGQTPDARMVRWPGGVLRGAERIGGLPPAYFHGLCSEAWDHGLQRWVHDKKRGRNEVLDTLVYAYFAALHPHLRLDLMTESQWRAIEAQWEPAVDLLTPLQQPVAEIELPDQAPPVIAPVSAPPPIVRAPPPSPIASDSWSRRL